MLVEQDGKSYRAAQDTTLHDENKYAAGQNARNI